MPGGVAGVPGVNIRGPYADRQGVRRAVAVPGGATNFSTSSLREPGARRQVLRRRVHLRRWGSHGSERDWWIDRGGERRDQCPPRSIFRLSWTGRPDGDRFPGSRCCPSEMCRRTSRCSGRSRRREIGVTSTNRSCGARAAERQGVRRTRTTRNVQMEGVRRVPGAASSSWLPISKGSGQASQSVPERDGTGAELGERGASWVMDQAGRLATNHGIRFWRSQIRNGVARASRCLHLARSEVGHRQGRLAPDRERRG